MGTSDCAVPEGVVASRGDGTALGGAALGIDLDTLAEARGVEVTNDGQRSIETAGVATPLGDDAYANPLNVVALSAVSIDLGRGLLQLPLDNSTGVLGQFGQATTRGHAVGAAGFVTDSGGIAVDAGDGYPELATLHLSGLLGRVNPAVAELIGVLTDVSLTIGAVAGRASLTGCDALWDGVRPFDPLSGAGNLDRDYLVASIATDIESPTISALGAAVGATTDTLQTTANGLVGSGGVLNDVLGPVVTTVTNALGIVTSLLGLRVTPGGATATLTALEIDLQPVRDLLAEPFGDDEDAVRITLADGSVRVDTAALLVAAYPGSYSDGLNGLEPNSEPLRDPAVLGALNVKLGEVLSDLLEEIDERLEAALAGATIEAIIAVPLQRCPLLCLGNWSDAGALGIHVRGTLAQLLADAAVVTVDTSALSALPLGALLGDLVAALTSGLTTTVGGLVGAAVDETLRPLAQLPASTMTSLGVPIIELVTTVYRELYVNGIISLMINVQNEPFSGRAQPPDWATLPSMRFDVAALRIGVLGALPADDVRLYFGRGSVGEVCSAARVASGGCPDY